MKIELVPEFCGPVIRRSEEALVGNESISLRELINVCKENLRKGVPVYIDGEKIGPTSMPKVTRLVGVQLLESLSGGKNPYAEFDNRHVRIYLSIETYNRRKESKVSEIPPGEIVRNSHSGM